MEIRNKKGFTLMEVLLAISVFSIIWIMCGNLLNYTFQFWSGESDYIFRKQKGEIALERMVNHLKKGRDISILGVDHDRIQFRGYYKEEGLKWITYKLYSSDDNLALGLKVAAKEGQGTIMPIINDVYSLKFEDINGDLSLVKIIIVINNDDKKRKFSSCVAPEGEEN